MHVIILSGGVGSRLWPVSRDLTPKPFMKLSDGQSFLQKVFLRSKAIPSLKSITTVTNKELFFKTKTEYDAVKGNYTLGYNFILEPFGRNTTAAVALAALEIKSLYGPESTLLMLPSDHLIADEKAFIQAVSNAEDLAKKGRIVTFGIKPTAPETGYGYIEFNGNDVVRFVEKPTLEKAKEYLQTHNFLWNSGMFCFTAESVLNEMEKHCPEILNAVQKCIQHSKLISNEKFRTLEIDPETFAKVPSNSIDYTVMERTQKAAVVPCEIGWSDIGNWSAMSELGTSDNQGNTLKGDVIALNINNCFIESQNRVVGAVGVENLIIVDTPDALLVACKSKVQDVKNIYAQLKDRDHVAHKEHNTVERPWGSFTTLEEGPGFKIKRIEVNPGASLSLQMHNQRSEHWVVVSGQALVVNGEEEFILETNESTFIPIQTKHRMTNPGDTKLIIIEVQTGGYLGEEDIIRFNDMYGRA